MMTCARISAEWQPAATASCATTLRPGSKVMKPAMTVTGTTPTAAPTTVSEHAAVMVFCGVTYLGAPGYEACDDGNVVDQDACRTGCVQARCGDGVRRLDLRQGDPDYEGCDDGNLNDGDDKCRTNCQVAVCGDGVRRADLPPGQLGYESCDDGNRLNADGCTNQCLIARCGDGVVRNDRAPGDFGYEACDDGN